MLIFLTKVILFCFKRLPLTWERLQHDTISNVNFLFTLLIYAEWRLEGV